MRIIDQIKILRRMQVSTSKDYAKCKIRSRRLRLADEIIAREKRIKQLINKIQIKWD